MKKIMVIVMVSWALLAGVVVWAAEKDCADREIKFEVGQRYIVKYESQSGNLWIVNAPASKTTQFQALKVLEISPSGKYVQVLWHGQKETTWESARHLEIVEKLIDRSKAIMLEERR